MTCFSITFIFSSILNHRESGKTDFSPVYNVTPFKLRKVINSAHYYLKTKDLDLAFSIDALIIRHDEVEFIENVTL